MPQDEDYANTFLLDVPVIETTSGCPNYCKKPKSWDAAVSAAYLLYVGATQEQASKVVGVTPRQIRRWLNSDWWPKAKEEAASRWLHGCDSLARKAALDGLTDHERRHDYSKWWLERREPLLSPPAQQVKLDGALELEHRTAEIDKARAKLDELIKAKRRPDDEEAEEDLDDEGTA